jgi:outer membrane protein
VNKLIKLAVLMVAVLSTSVVSADGKIAVLNPQQAIVNTEVAQQRLKALRAEASYAENRKQLETLGKSYQDKVAQLQKDAAVMSAEQQQAEAQKLQEKRSDIEHVQRKLQAAEQQLLQALAQEMAPSLQKVVGELIDSEGIGLLLNQQAAMHADSSFSITAKVTDKLNQMK